MFYSLCNRCQQLHYNENEDIIISQQQSCVSFASRQDGPNIQNQSLRISQIMEKRRFDCKMIYDQLSQFTISSKLDDVFSYCQELSKQPGLVQNQQKLQQISEQYKQAYHSFIDNIQKIELNELVSYLISLLPEFGEIILIEGDAQWLRDVVIKFAFIATYYKANLKKVLSKVRDRTKNKIYFKQERAGTDFRPGAEFKTAVGFKSRAHPYTFNSNRFFIAQRLKSFDDRQQDVKLVVSFNQYQNPEHCDLNTYSFSTAYYYKVLLSNIYFFAPIFEELAAFHEFVHAIHFLNSRMTHLVPKESSDTLGYTKQNLKNKITLVEVGKKDTLSRHRKSKYDAYLKQHLSSIPERVFTPGYFDPIDEYLTTIEEDMTIRTGNTSENALRQALKYPLRISHKSSIGHPLYKRQS